MDPLAHSTPASTIVSSYSDDSDSDEDALLSYRPFPSLKAPSASGGSVAGAVATKPEKKDAIKRIKEKESPEKIAENTVKSLQPPVGITSPSELYWQEVKRKKITKIYPLRVCRHDEGIGLHLQQNWDPREKALVQFLGRYETTARQVISRKQMVPYNGSQSDSDEWCPEHIEKYSKQLNQAKREKYKVLTELKLLEKILRHAKDREREEEEEEAERKQELLALRLEQENEESKQQSQEPQQNLFLPGGSDDDDDDDGILPLADESEKATEPLCVGDEITYCHPVYTSGDPRGVRTATVLSTDPNRDPILGLDNADCLPSYTHVKRIRVKQDGAMHEHPDVYRPIYRFRIANDALNKNNAGLRAGLQKEGQRLGRIMERGMEKFRKDVAGDDFAPTDIFHNFKTRKSASGKRLSQSQDTTDVGEEEDADIGGLVLATERIRAGEGRDVEHDRESHMLPPKPRQVDSQQHWIQKLEKQLSNLAKGTRRRGPRSHMTVAQLELALEVRHMLKKTCNSEGVVFEDGLQKLAKELDITDRGLKVFLEGDEGKLVGIAQHSDTEALLQEWKDDLLNKVSETKSTNGIQDTDDHSPATVTKEDGDSCDEIEDDDAGGVNAVVLSGRGDPENPGMEKDTVETSILRDVVIHQIKNDSTTAACSRTEKLDGKNTLEIPTTSRNEAKRTEVASNMNTEVIVDDEEEVVTRTKRDSAETLGNNATKKSKAVSKGRLSGCGSKRSMAPSGLVRTQKKSRKGDVRMTQKQLELADQVVPLPALCFRLT